MAAGMSETISACGNVFLILELELCLELQLQIVERVISCACSLAGLFKNAASYFGPYSQSDFNFSVALA